MKKTRAPSECVFSGMRNLSVRYVITSFTPGPRPAFRSGRCQGIGHAGKNMPCPSSAMSSGRLFLDGLLASIAAESAQGFHPEPLTDPCLSLSTHTARATPRKLPPSVETSRLLLLPVGQVDPDAGGPPPSLHGHYSVSSVLRGSPPLTGASVLSASRSYRLRLFLCHRQPGSQVPYESPDEIHAA
jgi:hypothetical protein